MNNRYTRYIPLGILLVLAIALGLAFGPRLYREIQLGRRCNAMLSSAKSGNLSSMLAFVESAQQQEVEALLRESLPADYKDHIASLKLSSLEATEPGEAWTYVTCRTEGEGSAGVYQGKLHWRLENGSWVWDFDGSYGSAYGLGAEPEWQSLGSYLALASQW